GATAGYRPSSLVCVPGESPPRPSWSPEPRRGGVTRHERDEGAPPTLRPRAPWRPDAARRAQPDAAPVAPTPTGALQLLAHQEGTQQIVSYSRNYLSRRRRERPYPSYRHSQPP